MIYTTVSIKQVLGNVVRNVDNKLPSYYMDPMLEWIGEAVEELRTPFTLDTRSTPNYQTDGALQTQNHVVKLPCGLVEIISVEDQYGCRMHRSALDADMENPTPMRNSTVYSDARVTDFITNTQVIGTGSAAGPSVPWDGSNIQPAPGPNTTPYYNLKLDYLQTSEESMFVKINYKSIPVDDDGYPLIPDQREYKEALYWYVLMKLVTSGYNHPVIPANLNGIEFCDQKYKEYAGRALGEIKTPDMDRMYALWAATVRLIPPVHFHDDFFEGSSEIQPIRYV